MREITFNQAVRYLKQGVKVYIKTVATGDFFAGTFLVPLDDRMELPLQWFIDAEYFVYEEDLV